MKQFFLVLTTLIGVCITLSSCKNEYENRTIWSSESMTMEDGEVVDIKYQMVYDEYYDSHLGENVCSLNKSRGGEWISTYFFRRGDKLYECGFCPFPYLTVKDEVSGRIKHPANELWKKKALTCESTPAYTVKQEGERLELSIDDTKYTFHKD